MMSIFCPVADSNCTIDAIDVLNRSLVNCTGTGSRHLLFLTVVDNVVRARCYKHAKVVDGMQGTVK